MKIYTKIGDKGETMLANGARVKKSSLRINTYGAVDEFNAHVGLLRDILLQDKNPPALVQAIINRLFGIQEELFAIGAELALAPKLNTEPFVSVVQLEKEIDEFWAQLPALRNFVLPGGHSANSHAHICRVVCRRCERFLCELHELDPVRPELLIFFNRLSDWFFATARTIHFAYGIDEHIWKPKN